MIAWAKNILDELANKSFTGKIEINFFSGGISNINKFESMKPPNFKKDIIDFSPRTKDSLKINGY